MTGQFEDSVRPAQPPPNNVGHFQIVILNIPPTATTRTIRKRIGRATYYIQRQPPIRFLVRVHHQEGQLVGHLTFSNPAHAFRFLDVHGGRHTRYPIAVDGVRLRFVCSKEPVDRFFLRAIRNRENEEEIDSDYDVDGEARDHELLSQASMTFSTVDCGAFDEKGDFCVGWRKEARTAHSHADFDIDQARLRIRAENLVIQATKYDIAGVYVDEKRCTAYWYFTHPPIFLRDLPPAGTLEPQAWIDSEKFDFEHPYDRAERVTSYDTAHANCAPCALVYRTHHSSAKVIASFLEATKGRLYIKARFKNVQDASNGAAAFNMPKLNEALKKLDFDVAFHAQALLHGAKLIPQDLIGLIADIHATQKRIGAKGAAAALHKLKGHLRDRAPLARAQKMTQSPLSMMREHLFNFKAPDPPAETSVVLRDQIRINTVLMTPSSLHMEGPHYDFGNRILRQYRGHEENFIRVRFMDEDGSQVRAALEYGNIQADDLIHSRFGGSLRDGIEIAGRKFVFLAYSQSGLREHSCWFIRPFKVDGKRITPDTVRANIGDLSHIQSPAKYAARMGQAFSTTSISLALPRSAIEVEEDVSTPDGKYDFTDGVGLMSSSVSRRINDQIAQRGLYDHALTSVQIRLGGVKGMLSEDPRLPPADDKIILRKSMVKFSFGDADTVRLEIASFFPRPLPMYLNRPMVALLESLGVSKEAFFDLQKGAVTFLQKASSSPEMALRLYGNTGLDRSSIASSNVQVLADRKMEPLKTVPFLREANLSLVAYALRNVKYRARVPVARCYTLPGIADFTNRLQHNQIIVCIADPDETARFLTGKCLVGRSPMLAPGDVQVVNAIAPPAGHPLRAQRNVVIFSQKGQRPLPSMLGGGDLDGDLYNVIQEEKLFPAFECAASDYAKRPPRSVDHPCTTDDVIDFFLDYMKNEKVGLIATRHLILSDQASEGVLDIACVQLAKLHSDAVDFGKTGNAPRLSEMPRCPLQKPDYMQSEFRLETARNGDGVDLAALHKHPRQKDLYYPSDKALGHMFRAVDVRATMQEWQTMAEGEANRTPGWMETLWKHLVVEGRPGMSKPLLRTMRREVQTYYQRLDVVASEHGQLHRRSLSEEEVYTGHVIRYSPHSTRMSLFDITKQLQDDFGSLASETRDRVLRDTGVVNAVDPNVFCDLWRFLTIDVVRPLTEENMEALQARGGGGGGVHSSMIEKLLLSIVERGVTFVRAALDAQGDTSRRSAPWIVVPAVLKAHRTLDMISEVNSKRTGLDHTTKAERLDDSESDAGSMPGSLSAHGLESSSTSAGATPAREGKTICGDGKDVCPVE